VPNVDAGLGTLIHERAETNGHEIGDAVRAELWLSSVNAYNARRRRENIAAWYAFHMNQAERIEKTARALAAEHRLKAEMLMENGYEETT
jgi:hypothetical protein